MSLNDSAMSLNNVPAFVSARSANTLISENRPTRIQAETLLVLNGLLDELLLTILTSAKSLATDRIKSDGMLRIFANNLLAKDAVLEAELELRSYVDGKRAEGAKVPLGLMSTSRLDGTDGFPFQSAYKALRSRCQYYSTLSDSKDENATKDQNIMSSDGRPVATVTPVAAIYVSALLEFVASHILQNVARVIERDNSDEASLYDLRAAITEDEQLNPLFNKLTIRQELARRIGVLESRNGAGRGSRSDARVVKPWHVPDERDFDEAAGPSLFSSKRASVQVPPVPTNSNASTSSSSRHGHAASSSLSNADSMRGSMSTLRTVSSLANHASEDSATVSSTAQKPARPSLSTSNPGGSGSIGRRQSSERSWSGVFGGIKRRNSFKQGTSDSAPTRPVLPTNHNANGSDPAESALDADDDFEALMLSSQTMKVSLTPNRLHTIEVAKKSQDVDPGSLGRRAGTPGGHRDASSATLASQASQTSASGEALPSGAGRAVERASAGSATTSDVGSTQPSTRASLPSSLRPERKAAAPPPSSYRGPSSAFTGQHALRSGEVVEEDISKASVPPPTPPPQSLTFRRGTPRLQPRNDEAERTSSTHKDLVDLFKSTPPSATSERFGNISSDTSSLTDGAPKKSAMGDRVRTLFGRRSASSSGHGTPSSPVQTAYRVHQHTDTKASLEGSQDTYITSSTTNSLDQTRSLTSANEPTFTRNNAASRSSTSTSEHPAATADVASDTKPKPDVTVSDTGRAGSNSALIGLGVGMAAAAGAAGAGAVAASRSASNASRSTSYGSQTPGAAEVAGQDDLQADDASTTSKSIKTPDELISRKVPWGYKRNSASANTVIERNGTPSSDRRRSVGYTSSNGHGVLPVRGQAGTSSSDAGHHSAGGIGGAVGVSPMTATTEEGAAAATARGNNAPTAWSGPVGASGSQVLVRRRSFGAGPASMHASRRNSTSLETIQVLAELERAMRTCHSVDECRALVQKAMHSDGRSFSPSSDRPNGDAIDSPATTEKGKPDTASTHATATEIAADGAVGTVTAADATDIPAQLNGRAAEPESNTRTVELKPSLVEEEGSSLEAVEQGLVVAWLLGGDGDPAPTRTAKEEAVEQAREENKHQPGKEAASSAVDTNGPSGKVDAATGLRQRSLVDSNASSRDVGLLASSSVVSLQSNYKDAEDDVTIQ
ncbi:hypothetical protein PHSY_001400 [Pseudozyma hubeiensis SY62]|uniref:Uncharacterized protein n=1 Tax=Pseudozyma hubeiensis (strain SY62) TaxID=1305764 RepID=R9P6Z4_PSEHS|nr:hypothetical protein PHSY_001400 [Pseudozyma hubeiensis SY62]GAC93835.1 hypothetical protein PHSY_001400 [Pseudozyma hubeiensis SY62]